MKTQIIGYYLSERQWATYGLILSVAMTGLSLFLWQSSSGQSQQRGFAYSLVVGGLLFSIATAVTISYNNKRIKTTAEVSGLTEPALKQREILRMEEVLRSAYRAGLTIFSAFLVAGCILLFWLKSPAGKGVAWGLVFLGAYGLAMEMISMSRNRAYLESVKAYVVNGASSSGKQSHKR